jgi:hypothetical protein
MQTEKADWIRPGYTTNKETYNQVCVFQIRLLNLHEILFFRLDGRNILLRRCQHPFPGLQTIQVWFWQSSGMSIYLPARLY